MKRFANGFLSAALALALATPALAANRGGTLVFARQLDSQFLDPVHTAQNADIWISLNLYDTLLLASADGKSTEPGLAAAHKVSDDGKTLTAHPIGSGPFVLTSWKRNAEMVMSRNPYYWKPGVDGKPLPYLDAVKFVIIPDDATRILKLKAGEIDAAEFVPYSRVTELKGDPKLNMVLFPAAQVNYFTLNTRPTLKDGTKNPLNDVRVRQALNYATDKDALIQVVSYGAGTPQKSFMPMSTPLAFGEGPL